MRVGRDFPVVFTALTATGEPASHVSLDYHLTFSCENNGGFQSEKAERIRERRKAQTDEKGKVIKKTTATNKNIFMKNTFIFCTHTKKKNLSSTHT